MMGMFQPERLLRFLDDLDSAAFALRAIWVGYQGRALRSLMLFLAVLAGSGVSPIFRTLVIAIVGTFMCAELVSLACSRFPPKGAARSHGLRS